MHHLIVTASRGNTLPSMPMQILRNKTKYSLGCLFLLVVLVAIPVAWVSNRAHQKQRQFSVLHTLNRFGPRYAPTSPDIESVTITCRQGEFGDQELRLLCSITSLKQLGLSGTAVGDDGIAHIVRLQNLEHLDLRSTAVTDGCVSNLKRLKNLTTLDIAETGITDAALDHLASLPSLCELHVGRTGMSTNALARFHRLCPNVRIRRWIPTGENTWSTPLWNVFLDGEVPQHPADQFFVKAQMAMDAGQHEEAIHYLTKSIRADPGYAEAHIERAIAYQAVGDLNGALRDLDRVIGLEPQHLPPREMRDVLVRRVNVLVRLGKHRVALQAARHAVEVAGDCVALMNLRALVLAASPDESLRDGQLALVIATNACQASRWQEAEPIAVMAAASAESTLR